MVVFIFEEQIAAAIEAHKPQKELTADCADSTASATCNESVQHALLCCNLLYGCNKARFHR